MRVLGVTHFFLWRQTSSATLLLRLGVGSEVEFPDDFEHTMILTFAAFMMPVSFWLQNIVAITFPSLLHFPVLVKNILTN